MGAALPPSPFAAASRILRPRERRAPSDAGEEDLCQLLAPVTIVDVAHFRTTRRDYEERSADQSHAAGTVALSRSEGMGPAEFEAVRAELALGPDVSFPLLHYDRWPREEWMRLLETRLPGLPGPPPPPPPLPQRPLTNMALRGVQSSPGEPAAKLEALVRGMQRREAR